MANAEGRITLSDDGTMDTVLTCRDCGEDFRYNYDPATVEFSSENPSDEECEQAYEEFVEWAIEDAESEHECPACPTCGTVHPANTCREG